MATELPALRRSGSPSRSCLFVPPAGRVCTGQACAFKLRAPPGKVCQTPHSCPTANQLGPRGELIAGGFPQTLTETDAQSRPPGLCLGASGGPQQPCCLPGSPSQHPCSSTTPSASGLESGNLCHLLGSKVKVCGEPWLAHLLHPLPRLSPYLRSGPTSQTGKVPHPLHSAPLLSSSSFALLEWLRGQGPGMYGAGTKVPVLGQGTASECGALRPSANTKAGGSRRLLHWGSRMRKNPRGRGTVPD